MASSFNTLRLPQTHPPSQFIPYNGPPKPKPSSRHYPPKNAPSSADDWHNIDKILAIGLGSNTESMDRGVLAPTSHRAEVVGLTCSDGKINGEIGGIIAGGDGSTHGDGGSGGVGGNDDCSLHDQWESVGCEQSGCPKEVSVERRDDSSNQYTAAEGSSREDAVVINDDQTKSVSDSDNEDEHRPWEDDMSTQMDKQENSGTSALECCDIECHLGVMDAIDSEMAERARNRVGSPPRRELPSTPPKSTVGESPTRTSCEGEAKKTVHFADPLLMTDTESGDTLDCHRVILEIDGDSGDAQSDYSIDQPTKEASSHILLKATTHQSQSPIEKKAKKQGEFPTLENASSSSGYDDDDNESDNHTARGTLMTRKRKRSQPANIVSHKRHNRTSNTTSKQHPKRAAHSARRQKPFLFRGRSLSSRLSAPHSASGAQPGSRDTRIRYSDDSSDESSEGSGDRGGRLRSNEGPKSIGSFDCSRRLKSIRPSRSNTKSRFPSSAHAPPHTTVETRSRPSANGVLPGQAQRHLPDIAIHPLSTDMAFLTALFRGRGGMGILSTTQAVTLLENVVGNPTKLGNITVKPLTPDIWFLTCFMYYASDTTGCRTHQPAPALPSLPTTRADTASPRGDDRSSDDNVDDNSSSDDDDNDERLSNNNDEPSSSRKHSPWSQEDEDRLRIWKQEDRPWDWICSQFPSRSAGAVRLRWYTKLREKA